MIALDEDLPAPRGAQKLSRRHLAHPVDYANDVEGGRTVGWEHKGCVK